MKVLIVGAYGQLGSEVSKKLSLSYEIVQLGSKELDIGNEERVLEVIKSIRPVYIVNCAAYNNVNQAEVCKELARYVNEIGVYNLAKASELVQATLVHISTDYVFNGEKRVPYVETDIAEPINAYGLTKYNGEQFVQDICQRYIIIRTAWLYSQKENNFVHTVMKIGQEKKQLRVINDHIGSPTNVEELANVIEQLMSKGGQGIYHCSGNGMCSWYEFAKKIIQLSNIDCFVEPISAREYKELAPKPAFSVLRNLKLEETIGDPMKNWEDSLETFFAKYRK